MTAHSDQGHGSLSSYIIGFIISIALTLIAYYVVVEKVLSPGYAIGAVVTLAALQLLVQLLFFLHMGSESRPRWNLLLLLFMILVLVIIVWGSLWIMDNLNTNVMPVMDMKEALHHQA
ncbi:MAG: cytochrome o ubiquinol oxidase subunit IV [Chlamydiales bacterium]|nr:cytochrome o ubiquinol oxidase subunit IV [Chlamydiales bacterium]